MRAASAKVKPAAPFSRDQAERRLQQRLFQIAVMIAALGAALFLAPAHVKDFYMSRAQRSLARHGQRVISSRLNGSRPVNHPGSAGPA